MLFAYTSSRPGFVYVVARTSDGGAQWLRPATPGDAPVAIGAVTELAPLGVQLTPEGGPWGAEVELAFVLVDVASARLALGAAVDGGAALARLGEAIGATTVVRHVRFYPSGEK